MLPQSAVNLLGITFQRQGAKWSSARDQLAQQYPKAVNVTARINIQAPETGLLGTHVSRGANDKFGQAGGRVLLEMSLNRAGDSKINDFGHRHAVMHRDQNIRWLDVAMNDALVMRVLDRLADLDKQENALTNAEVVLLAIVGDLDAIYQLHDEIRPARHCAARVQHARNGRMVHQSQRLTFCLETRDDAFVVHPHFDDLDGYAPVNRLFLLGHV